MTTLLDTALRYHRAGLVVLPNDPVKKYPVKLREWQSFTPTEQNLFTWYDRPGCAIGLRDVEGLDFDNKGQPDAETLYREWYALCDHLAPGLPDRLLLEQTPSGGYHVAWECEIIAGNQKLATRPPTDAERATNPRLTFITLIETRGKGGQFQVAPSPGYRLIRGDWAELPTITPAERLIILDCARALTQADSRALQGITTGGDRPGDVYNRERADDAYQLLIGAGWTAMYQRGTAVYLCRPGKDRGVSATFGHVAPGVLYVFSSSASPFEANRAYAPFAVYTEMEHGGDYKKAAAALHGSKAQSGEIINQRDAPPARPVNQVEYITDWRPSVTSAADLHRKIFPILVWIVDGLIPEGAVVLAGKPKSKKSWLALAIAIAVAYGGKAFGYYDVTFGRVLYLDLESNQRRMQGRLRAVIGDREAWPEHFDIATEWKRGDEGIAYLDGYCEAHPDTRLIVIDIWAKFRAPRDPKADPYEQDYNALQALNAWAERRRVTVIVIHHTRKAKADDVFEEISGTTGIIGAVATAMVLTRSPDVPEEQILHLRGRDLIEDDPIALKWDNYTCQHLYVATGAEASSSAQRRQILEAMDDEQEYPVKEIARLMGKSVKAVDNQLRRLIDDQLVVRTGRGMYAKVLKPDGNDGNDGSSGNDGKRGKFSSLLSTPDQSVEKGVEKGLGHQEAANDTFHVFHGDSQSTADHDFSIDYVEFEDRKVWRLWDDITNTVLSEHTTEAEAQAEADRRRFQ